MGLLKHCGIAMCFVVEADSVVWITMLWSWIQTIEKHDE